MRMSVSQRGMHESKTKPHKRSLVVEDQNDVKVLGLCRYAPEEFGNKYETLTALFDCKKDASTRIITIFSG